ncbi:L-fucose transporter [Salmonella enterica subsp. enterica]|nr:L-fucose transporter [Salmonella enterica subsp. enterica]
MVCFFIGRFTGTWLISRFAPHKVLAAYALFAMLLCLISAFSGGHIGLLALTLCSAFMSIQYPTIFSLGIKNLGQDTKYGSSFIVMTIIGGGIVTPVMASLATPQAKSRPPNWFRHCALPSSSFLPVSVHKRRQTEHLSE